MNSDAEEPSPVGQFVHLDVLTAHSPWCSPSTPEQYIQALARQYRLGPTTDSQPKPALAIADYGLHSAVKTAVAFQRAGIEHLVGLRVRVVPERGKRTFLKFHSNACRYSEALARGHDRNFAGCPLWSRTRWHDQAKNSASAADIVQTFLRPLTAQPAADPTTTEIQPQPPYRVGRAITLLGDYSQGLSLNVRRQGDG